MIYYCKKCKTLTNETDIIPGKTYDVDAYKNSSCPECGSENIIELEADALCPTCGDYHEDDYDYKDCADKLFYDMYIISYLKTKNLYFAYNLYYNISNIGKVD